MKTMKFFAIIGLASAIILSTTACGDGSTGSKDGEFQMTESGLEYVFHKQNPDSKKPMEEDFVTGTGIYKVGDTVFFDSRENPTLFHSRLCLKPTRGIFLKA